MAAVTSQDGFIAHPNTPVYNWTSPEEKREFDRLKSCFDVFLMGSKTYDAMKAYMQPRADLLRIIFTSDTKKYALDANEQLRFTSKTATDAVEQLQKQGYQKALLLGGSFVYSQFLHAGLVDEIFLTREPVILAGDTPLLAGGQSLSDYPEFRLQEHTELNENGTILEHFVKIN